MKKFIALYSKPGSEISSGCATIEALNYKEALKLALDKNCNKNSLKLSSIIFVRVK